VVKKLKFLGYWPIKYTFFNEELKFLFQTFHTYFLNQSIFEASEALQNTEGMILKKNPRYFYLCNSEVETTWISLIG
jgi:hypothetical protein